VRVSLLDGVSLILKDGHLPKDRNNSVIASGPVVLAATATAGQLSLL
jgi:hypothetical protein